VPSSRVGATAEQPSAAATATATDATTSAAAVAVLRRSVVGELSLLWTLHNATVTATSAAAGRKDVRRIRDVEVPPLDSRAGSVDDHHDWQCRRYVTAAFLFLSVKYDLNRISGGTRKNYIEI